MPKHVKSWEAEHGKGYEIPHTIDWLVNRKVLVDSSWHNDMSPSFMIPDPVKEDYGLRIWVDHPIHSLREVPGTKRFMLQEGEFTSEADFEFETDDLEELLLKLFERAGGARYEHTKIHEQEWFSPSEPRETLHELIQALNKR